jgi:hypothetical protein
VLADPESVVTLGRLGSRRSFMVVRIVFAALSLIYLPLVLRSTGWTPWGAPWQPRAGGDGTLLFTIVVMLGMWADAWIVLPWLARRKAKLAAATDVATRERSARGTFFVRACLLYSGAPGGAGLSFATHDARYAVLFAAAAIVMVVLLPSPQPPA